MTNDPALQTATRIDALWDFNDPAASEQAFRALQADAGATAAPELLAQLHTQIARAQGLQRAFDDAGRTLDAIPPLLSSASPLAAVRLALERGRLLNSSGRPEAAQPQFEAAFEQATREGLDFYAVDAAHMIAIVAPPDDALVWNERALELARGSSDERARGWVGSLCNNLGWTHHAAGAYEEALRMFELALAAREIQGKPADIRVAKWCVSRCLRSLGRIDEALAGQRALAQEIADAGAQQDGCVSEEIGECLLALGRADEARPAFADASRLLGADPWLREQEPERLARLAELAGA